MRERKIEIRKERFGNKDRKRERQRAGKEDRKRERKLKSGKERRNDLRLSRRRPSASRGVQMYSRLWSVDDKLWALVMEPTLSPFPQGIAG